MTAHLSSLAALFVVAPAFFVDGVADIVGAVIKRAPRDERTRLVSMIYLRCSAAPPPAKLVRKSQELRVSQATGGSKRVQY